MSADWDAPTDAGDWPDALLSRKHDPEVRATITARYDRLARRLAGRYRGRGEPVEDLEQVARIGLLNALDRFDPEYGARFSTYATKTILGELKRHLRDRAWSVRAPRSLQERWLETSRAIEDLTHRLGRTPSIAELAAAIDLTEEEVLEGLDAGGAYTAGSLDVPVGEDQDSSLIDLIGSEDPDLASVPQWTMVADSIRSLPKRQRHILYLRFFEGKTQREIGVELGLSQMHISRLLRRSLELVRASVGSDDSA